MQRSRDLRIEPQHAAIRGVRVQHDEPVFHGHQQIGESRGTVRMAGRREHPAVAPACGNGVCVGTGHRDLDAGVDYDLTGFAPGARICSFSVQTHEWHELIEPAWHAHPEGPLASP